MILGLQQEEEYVSWIKNTYKTLQESKSEKIRRNASDGLYAFYIGRKQYAEAEECLEYYAVEDPERKRKLAPILYGTGKYDEAYKTLEELLFFDYQRIIVELHELFTLAMETDNPKKAKTFVEKAGALAKLFEMGEYHENACRLEYAAAMKNGDETLEHMDFNPSSSSFAQTMIASQLKHFLEDDTYSFAKESPKWETFKEKWTS